MKQAICYFIEFQILCSVSVLSVTMGVISLIARQHCKKYCPRIWHMTGAKTSYPVIVLLSDIMEYRKYGISSLITVRALTMDERLAKIHSAKGLITAPFTPFKANGEVNLDLIPKYIDHLVKNNVRGAFVNGTTGEGVSLTVEERKQIAEQWVSAGKEKLDVVIIQIGTSNIKDSQELAKHAEKIGATAIASLPPLYYKPAKEDQLIQYLKAIASAAPSIPFMYYHIPSFTGVEVSLSTLLHDGQKQIPTFCGAKYTSGDNKELLKSLQLEKFKILTGYDECLLAGLPLGITAVVGATYNFMPAPSNQIFEAHNAGNMTIAWQKQMYIWKVLNVIGKYGNIMSALKTVMNLFGPFDVGEPRLPLTKLTEEQVADIKTELSKMDPISWYN